MTSKTDKTVARVREIIRNNGRLTIREVAEDRNIIWFVPSNINHRIGHEPNRSQICSSPLTDEQKQNQKTIAQELFERAESDLDFLKKYYNR